MYIRAISNTCVYTDVINAMSWHTCVFADVMNVKNSNAHMCVHRHECN